MRLAIDDVQGNITPGFRKDAQDFVFVRFPDSRSGRDWLGSVFKMGLSSTRRVGELNSAHREAKIARVKPDESTCANVALSFRGFRRLDTPDLNRFPSEFSADLSSRAAQLREQAMDGWEFGGRNDTEPDALLMLGADSVEALERLRNHYRRAMDECGVSELAACRGETLGGGRNHLGFKEGISQPDPDQPTEDGWTPSPDGQIAAPGEFILGQPNASGASTINGPEWARNGSYLVFVKFRQHPDVFERTIEDRVHHLREQGVDGIGDEQLAAMLVGRRKDGLRLDALGDACPLFAHIRKAYPRDHPELEPNRHRIIRRGIPYGDSTQSEKDCGLLFLAYQASIRDQFEHILTRWLKNSTFPPPAAAAGFRPTQMPSRLETPGWDPFVGPGIEGGSYVMLHKPGAGVEHSDFVPLSLREFTEVLGVAYFFSPAIPCVEWLARAR
jgi:Dyp-type peroxidase family